MAIKTYTPRGQRPATTNVTIPTACHEEAVRAAFQAGVPVYRVYEAAIAMAWEWEAELIERLEDIRDANKAGKVRQS